ncbi:DUF6273 domain-containing protein [Holdemanella sp.]|uniref:DUF6273 domain-containing protein n=1 Tax=Holdemanella sp. TaxID=1971762 RepID=UPI003AF059C1
MKHICLKTGTRILSGILSMSMMAGILSMPVMANETDTYKPVNDLKFTSNIKMNTEMETEEDGSTATDNTVQESEPASNENVSSSQNTVNSSPSESDEQQASGELKSETTYSSDNTSATLHMEYTDSGKTLELTEDSSEFYKDVFDKKLLVQNDSSKNVLDFTANSNGVYCFDVNVKDDKGTVIDTQQVRFKILDIVEAENEEVQQDENAVAPASVQTNSTVQASHDSKSLGVSYTSNGSYAWTIPSEIDLNKQDTLTVSATKVNEEANASLKISVKSENGFNMKSSSGRMGAYKITKDGNQIVNNSIVLETTSSGTTTADLKFTANPANFMTSGTYNDTLTFKAQNGYATGTVLEIEGMKFIVMCQTDDDTYMLIDGESLGNMQYQPNVDSDGNYKVGTYETPDEKRSDGQYSNTYEGSYIDNYLENTWYKQLPEKLQKAIQATDIKQAAYNNTSSNPKWRWFDPNGGENNDWYYNEGTTENPKWVIYYKASFPDDAQGAYPLNCWKYSEKGYNNTTYNTISRHVFLPSVEEVSNLVDLNNANKVYSFLKGTNNSLYHMWFRDSYTGSPRYAMVLSYDYRFMYYNHVTHTWIGVRPAFTVDLSTVSVSVVDSVNYK